MYSLTMPTTNQFDDPFSIRLGDDHLSALETLESMMQLFDIGEKNSVSIRDVSGQEMRVYYTSGFGGGLVNFSRKGFAGHAGLAKSELEKLIQRFKSAKGIE